MEAFEESFVDLADALLDLFPFFCECILAGAAAGVVVVVFVLTRVLPW